MQADSFKTLIVDDDKKNLKILSELLKEDTQVILAKDAAQALDRIAQYQPDLILLDVMLPGIDGFSLMEALKRRNSTRPIPVIFITGLTDIYNEQKGFELGAADYIQKPFHAPIVRARVRLHLEMVKQRKMLEQLAHIDPLTSVANRRRFDENFTQVWDDCAATGQPLSFAIVDIDFFKKYNDEYGHGKGDVALTSVAKCLDAVCDFEGSLVARYGGEEFAILMPDIGLKEAAAKMETARQAVQDLKIEHQASDACEYLSISVGVASCIPGAESDICGLKLQADQMLYGAKNKCKNSVQYESMDTLSAS